MAAAKITTLTFRIAPDLKEALRMAADQEHRSLANMVEVLIRDYCKRKDIPISQASGQVAVRQKPSRARK